MTESEKPQDETGQVLDAGVSSAGETEKKKEKKKFSVKKLIWNAFFYVVIVGGIVFGLPKFLVYTLHTDSPMAAITSGSMWPVLKTGDLVFIKGVTDISEVKEGDIIVFKNESNGTLTIHRIVAIKSGIITTKGDANFTEDTPISFDEVIGKTLNWSEKKPVRVPYLGSVTVFVSKYRNK